jgi:hypothetical protein
MEFRIADTFTAALGRLNAQEQKAAKTTAFDLQLDPGRPGLQFHRIDKSKDANFWSIRVNADIQIIIHRTASSLLLCYVDHHDKAYAWAERRRIEAHPRTGAIQIVEVRERVEEIAPSLPPAFPEPPVPNFIFKALSNDDLARIGVPADWVGDVRQASEDGFFEVAAHLPAEAAEALLEYAASGRLPIAAEVAPPPTVALSVPGPFDQLAERIPPRRPDPYAHPDTQRRIRTIESVEELVRALEAPWETWSVFLHPSQRSIVAQTYSGPARVAGSAGTGKTVVALHRAARLGGVEGARVLLTTFSQPLANLLQRKLAILIGEKPSVVPKITVTPFRGVAEELYQLAFGRRPQVVSEDAVRSILAKSAESQGVSEFTSRFLVSEWTYVVDAWQIDSAEAYASVPRLGRKNRMSAKQRARLWPVFARTRASLNERGLYTWAQIFAAVTANYLDRTPKPFTHIMVDEAQDLGVPELRMLAAIAPAGRNALFFAGDLGQRIFQQPFSWKSLGVDVRGRPGRGAARHRFGLQRSRAGCRRSPDHRGGRPRRWRSGSAKRWPQVSCRRKSDYSSAQRRRSRRRRSRSRRCL